MAFRTAELLSPTVQLFSYPFDSTGASHLEGRLGSAHMRGGAQDTEMTEVRDRP